MALSGSQITSVGVLGFPGRAYTGFVAKEESIVVIWTDQTPVTTTWVIERYESQIAEITLRGYSNGVITTTIAKVTTRGFGQTAPTVTWTDQTADNTTWTDS